MLTPFMPAPSRFRLPLPRYVVDTDETYQKFTGMQDIPVAIVWAARSAFYQHVLDFSRRPVQVLVVRHNCLQAAQPIWLYFVPLHKGTSEEQLEVTHRHTFKEGRWAKTSMFYLTWEGFKHHFPEPAFA